MIEDSQAFPEKFDPDVSGDEKKRRFPVRRLLAALLSCAIPGCGEWLIGDTRGGVIFLAVVIVTTAMIIATRALGSYRGMGWLTLLVVLWCWSPINTLLSRRSLLRPASGWWILLVLPFALLGASTAANGVARASGFRPFGIPSGSMEPTIAKGDDMMVDCRAYRYVRPKINDLVVFRKNDTFLVKRVVAIGGDAVEGEGRTLLVNGHKPIEPFVQYDAAIESPIEKFGPVRVAEDELFVAGDNRDYSFDSRTSMFGSLKVSEVVGRPIFVFRGTTSQRTGTRLR